MIPRTKRKVGKNLCPTDGVRWEVGALASANVGDLYTESANAARLRLAGNLISVIPSAKYTISCSSQYQAKIFELTFDNRITSSSGVYASSATYTLQANTVKCAVFIKRLDDGNILPSELPSITPQFEVGAVVTAFTPYRTRRKQIF